MSEKKERSKEFYTKNKKKCLTAGVLLLAGLVYVFCGQEISVETITDMLCNLVGGC